MDKQFVLEKKFGSTVFTHIFTVRGKQVEIKTEIVGPEHAIQGKYETSIEDARNEWKTYTNTHGYVQIR